MGYLRELPNLFTAFIYNGTELMSVPTGELSTESKLWWIDELAKSNDIPASAIQTIVRKRKAYVHEN